MSKMKRIMALLLSLCLVCGTASTAVAQEALHPVRPPETVQAIPQDDVSGKDAPLEEDDGTPSKGDEDSPSEDSRDASPKNSGEDENEDDGEQQAACTCSPTVGESGDHQPGCPLYSGALVSLYASGPWDGTTKTAPSQVSGVYQISNGAELAWLGGSMSAKAKLIDDIDLGGHEWIPIGAGTPFTGSFDGDGHTVSNFTVKASSAYKGLFGQMKSPATIKNVKISGITISGGTGMAGETSGAVVGLNNGGTVENCSLLDGVMEPNGAGGGIVGDNLGTVRGCYNAVEIMAGPGGGIVGRNYGTIATSYNEGKLVSNPAGGIAGNNGNGKIVDCYNNGEINRANSGYHGGIVGTNSGTVERCYNAGNFTGTKGTNGCIAGENTESVSGGYFIAENAQNLPGVGEGADNSVGMGIVEMGSQEFATLLGSAWEYHAPSGSTYYFPTLVGTSATPPSATASGTYYTVSVDTGITNGTVTVSPKKAKSGTAIKVAVQPDAGYQLVDGSLKYGNSTVPGNNTFTMPSRDVTVSASFELIPVVEYRISIDSMTNGSVSASLSDAKVGTAISLTVQPDPGYRLKADSLKYNDGSTDTPISGTSFTMPAKNITIKAEFELIPPTAHSVTIAALQNGSVTASPTSAVVNETITLTVTPAEGYRLKEGSLKYNDGLSDTAITGTTFTMPGSDVTVSAEFELIPPTAHSVTIAALQNGSITASPTSALKGETITLTVTPAENYGLKEGSLKYNDGTSDIPITGMSFPMPDKDVTVSAIFEKLQEDTYTITVNPMQNGTVEPLYMSAKAGTTITLTVTPDAGYQLKAGSLWCAMDNGTAVAINNLAFVMPAANVMIDAEFEPLPPTAHSVTVAALQNGRITASPMSAIKGTTITLTVTPDAGYQLKAGTLRYNDGTDHAISGTTFVMPDKAVTVKAEFEKLPPTAHLITVAALQNGKITVSPASAIKGTTITLTVTPDAGYQLKAGTLRYNDGTDHAISGTTFVMPDKAVTVKAEFEKLPPTAHLVTVAALQFGQIIAEPYTAAVGTTIGLTIRPEEGYQLKAGSLVYNDGTDHAISGTTFVMPDKDVTVKAIFEPKPLVEHAIAIAPMSGGAVTAQLEKAVRGTQIRLTVTPGEGFRLKPGSLMITTPDGKQSVVTGDAFTMPDMDVTVSASFEETGLLIYSKEDLVRVADLIRTDAAYGSATVRLMKDISVKSLRWEPIMGKGGAFSGLFDGGGHTISGLAASDNKDAAGLFAQLGKGGTIKDLRLTDVSFSTHRLVGAVAARNEGTISGCTVTGRMESTNDAFISFMGGIAGFNSGKIENCTSAVTNATNHINARGGGIAGQNTGSISGCKNTASVSGNFCGGIVSVNSAGGTVSGCTNSGQVYMGSGIGSNHGTAAAGIAGSNAGTVSDCNNTGWIHTTDDVQCSAAGIAGSNSGTVRGCANYAQQVSGGGIVSENQGTVRACYNAGDVTSTMYAGGIVKSNRGTVSESLNTGKIDSRAISGGIVGWNNGGVADCYNNGVVTNGTMARYKGGIAGRNFSTIRNSYNIGVVQGSGSTVGAVTGSNEGSVSNCYFDLLTSSQETGIGSGSGSAKGLRTPDMVTQNFARSLGSSYFYQSPSGNVYYYPHLTALDYLEPVSATLVDGNTNKWDRPKDSTSSSAGGWDIDPNAGRTQSTNVSSDGTVNSKTLLSQAEKALKDSGGKGVSLTIQNADRITAATLQALAEKSKTSGGKTTLYADTVVNGKIQGRIYIDAQAAAAQKSDIKLGVHTDAASVKPVQDKFTSSFDNKVAVVKLDQQEDFGTGTHIAVKLDTKDLNTQSLHFYAYDAKRNTYRIIDESNYYIDKNGFLHFTSAFGGYIVVTDHPLTAK